MSMMGVMGQMALVPQTDTWNSTFSLDTAHLESINLNTTAVSNLELAINFERSNWAAGSTSDNSVYIPAENSTSAPPGSLLKVEQSVDVSSFTLPPNVALSRIQFATVNLQNQTIPASAYVLWPYIPLQFPNLTDPHPPLNSSKYPVVAWAHGTSGLLNECGPSHYRNLYYQYAAPFELALSGYVVVAPDYQGLGINTTVRGEEIVHPYLAHAVEANDLFYATEAAQAAFPSLLSKEFMVMGHSQGGGAAWGAAIRQAQQPVEGYLGTVAASPTTNMTGFIKLAGPALPPSLSLGWINAVRALYPDFNLSSVLTPQGVARLEFAREQSLCNAGFAMLTADLPQGDPNGTIVSPTWSENSQVAAYLQTNNQGTEPIAGPMLVLQGTADPAVPPQLTDASVAQTCAATGGKGIEYVKFAGVTHIPVLFASQRIWLGFLNERFMAANTPQPAGSGADHICVTTNYTSALPYANYGSEIDYYMELATSSYQVA